MVRLFYHTVVEKARRLLDTLSESTSSGSGAAFDKSLKGKSAVSEFIIQRYETIKKTLENEFRILQELKQKIILSKYDPEYPNAVIKYCSTDNDIKSIMQIVTRKLPKTANDILKLTAMAVEFTFFVFKHSARELKQKYPEKYQGLLAGSISDDIFDLLSSYVVEHKYARLAKILWLSLDILQFLILYRGIQSQQTFFKQLALRIHKYLEKMELVYS